MFSISRLVCLLLLWSFTVAVTARTATPGSPLKDSIVEAQDNFLNAQGTIIRIHAGEVIAGSLDELKSRLAILETEIENLNQSLKSNNLTISYSAIDSRLRSLQLEFHKHNVFEIRTILFRDIIADIRSQRFLLADEKLIQLDDLEAVQTVVHEVYAHSMENLGLVLNFSSAVSDSPRCLAVLGSLYKEVSMDGENKALNLIRLAHSIETKGLNCNSSDTGFKLELINQIEELAADILIVSMKSGNFSSSENVRLLLNALYDFSPKEFDIVMKRLIDGCYGVIESRVILANICIRCNTAQAISGIGNFLYKTKDGGIFNDSDLIIDIASNLSDLRNRMDFADISKEIKSFFDLVVGDIPKCAKNLFFEESVCFWNKAKNVYLQAVNDKFNYDVERRRVLAAPGSEVIPQGAQWIPMRQDDHIFFISRDYPKEYLYYANFKYQSDMRFLFSWIKGWNKGNKIDNQSSLKIQLLNDASCYLKSTKHNEYMFASDVKFEKDNNYSYVFTRKAVDAGGLDSAFAWQIKAL